VAKEVVAIKYGNTGGHSMKKFLESPFAGKHPELISKGTKAAAAEARIHSRGRLGRDQPPGY
jgi:hypothetical protein